MINVKIDKSTKLPFEKSAYISFDYNPQIVQAIKLVPHRQYNPDNKTWEIPVDKVNKLLNQFKGTPTNIEGEIELKNTDIESVELPEGFKFKTQPYEHQEIGVKFGLMFDNWFLGDEQGLGKTKQIIDIAVARKIKYGYKHCLIVCGVNTLKWNWVNEILIHSNEKPWILGQKETRKGTIKIGSTKDKINDLKYLLTNETTTYFLITNIESFRDSEFADTVKKLCDKEIINMCAADEVHKMKNPTSQQTKGFFKCQPKCKIAMTGTPIMNNPLDIYVTLKWLGFENHAFYSFKQHYCIMGGFGGYDIVGYKNLAELQEKVNDLMLRRLKDEVFDLPEKVYVDELIEMTPKQQVLYNEAESYIKTNMDLITSNPDPLSSLIRLRQVTGYTGIVSSEIQESAKLDRMEDIVEEAMSNKKQVVIFSNWTQMTSVIYERLHQKYTLSLITGGTKDEVRQTNVEQFQNGNSKIIVGTIGAMGTGLTLTAGTVVIFLDHPWNRALYDQAVDRCHRIGQKQSITIYNLMCKDTIDERVWQLVKDKGAISDMLIDGKVTGNKTELLNFLLS